MSVNVQVDRNNNESSANVIRRFTKRVQNAGIVRKVRNSRYYTRTKSENVRRFSRLKKLIKKDDYEQAVKLGKISDQRR